MAAASKKPDLKRTNSDPWGDAEGFDDTTGFGDDGDDDNEGNRTH
jgi:hypothetical protein